MRAIYLAPNLGGGGSWAPEGRVSKRPAVIPSKLKVKTIPNYLRPFHLPLLKGTHQHYLSNNQQAIDGPTPEKALASDADIEYPSRLSDVSQRYIDRFLSFRLLVVVLTVTWLGQSFTWGGLYLGCGLTVAVSVAALAGLIVKDYVSQGSIVSRCVRVFC